jgi:hypothetical protein
MGDCGNIVVKQSEGGRIFLYTYYEGSNLKEVVGAALARQERWDDEPYLTRIIVAELMRRAGGLNASFGMGISTYECDNEHDHVIVDATKQEVREGGASWTFKEFEKMFGGKAKRRKA